MLGRFLYFPFVLLLVENLHPANGFCESPPLGHLCRSMDLTGFCLQASHIIRIRNAEIAKPYSHMDMIFDKLESKEVEADKPFVHFGAYKRQSSGPLDASSCLIGKDCLHPNEFPNVTDGSNSTNSSDPAPKPCRPIECKGVNLMLGVGEPGAPPPPEKGDVLECPPNCRCCALPPPDDVAKRTIFSLQDACELKYLKSPVKLGQGKTLTSFIDIKANEMAKENPYHLEVTEITIDGVRLHNWLHIRIYHNKSANTFEASGDKDFGKGKIKMAFLQVNDAMGYPVGEFYNTIPCEHSCKCEEQNVGPEKNCYQGSRRDSFPCAFDSERVVSNTGMMMFHVEDDKPGKGFKEIHATWRFAQSRSPEHFHTELHFHALLVDDFSVLTMQNLATEPTVTPGLMRVGAASERTTTVKEGIFGWNPIYTILHPTNETVGSYDYFREDVFEEYQIDCHKPISEHHYIVEPYPTSGPTIKVVPKDNPHIQHCYRLNNTFYPDPSETAVHCFGTGETPEKRTPATCPQARAKAKPFFHDTFGFIVDGKTDKNQIYPWTLYGARSTDYALRDGGIMKDNTDAYSPQEAKTDKSGVIYPPGNLYFGTRGIAPAWGDDSIKYSECAGVVTDKDKYWGKAHLHTYPTRAEKFDSKAYGHFCKNTGHGRRVLNLPGGPDNWPNTLSMLWKATGVDEKSYDDDRCYCPTLPGTPDPRFKEPPEIQVQGRRQHAYQMIIAWNCIIPFSIFVSRYYKETYSKVYFLQEFWWYTTHVMCMVSAAMFTAGGIYVMELKRRDPINWLDPNITAHIVIGTVIISMFAFQVVSGFFRVTNVKKRIFNIFMHWLFGVLEYFLAVACMVNSAFVLMSGMTCAGVIALGFLLVFQALFYASMEVHMRAVDKQLKLTPPRSYLPPPIMRVFHKDAPDSKFRIYVLLAYLVLCVSSCIIQFSAMESNTDGESCFIKSTRYYEQQKWEKQQKEEEV